MNLKRIAKYVGGFFVILAVLFLICTLPSIIPHTLTTTQKQENIAANVGRAQSASVLGIFANNYLIAGFSLFPFAGWIFDGLVLWKTGLVVASYNLPAYWMLTTVFGWIELSVYSAAILQSIRILDFYRHRSTVQFWRSTTKVVVYTLCVSGIILLFSATWEYIVILRNVVR